MGIAGSGVVLDPSRRPLKSNLTLYVNGATGSDSNPGRSSAAPFATIAAAVAAAYRDYDAQGYTITVSVAYAGGHTYTDKVPCYGQLTGGGVLQISGSGGSAIVSATAGNCFTIDFGARVTISGFDLRTTTSGQAIQAAQGAYLFIGADMIYGACAGGHIDAGTHGRIVCGSDYTINGSAAYHWHAPLGSSLEFNGCVVTIAAPVTMANYFLGIGLTGKVQLFGTTFVNPGNVTGAKFVIHYNGALRMDEGVDPWAVIPGTGAGFVGRGGIANEQTSTTAQEPDSTARFGNTRGSGAVDWQTIRTTAAQVASGARAFIGGGQANTASGADSAVAGGAYNVASNSFSWVPGGFRGDTRGSYSRGAWASGMFLTSGDAQAGEHVLRRQTTSATAVRLTADALTPGSTNIANLPNSGTYVMKALVVARQIGGTAGTAGDSKAWEATFAMKRGASAATTALIGAATITTIANDAAAAAWTIAVAADSAGGVGITATGEADKTINWVARILSVEVVG